MYNIFDRRFGKSERPSGKPERQSRRVYREGREERHGGDSGYYRGMNDGRYADDISYADDEYLLEEIARLKAQTEELRRILQDRQTQINEIGNSCNSAILKVAESLNTVIDKIDEAESNIITETVDGVQEGITAANKPLENTYRQIAEELKETIESFKFDIVTSSEKIGEVKGTVDELHKVLEEKADKSIVASLHQRFTTMFAVCTVGLVGTIMTLGLLCYLIISIAR